VDDVFFCRWPLVPCGLVVTRCDVFAANQKRPLARDLDLDATNRRPDRSFARPERVIQRDDWRGFGEAVALDHGKASGTPELLYVRWQRRGTYDERPELESKRGVQLAIMPPSARDAHACRRSVR